MTRQRRVAARAHAKLNLGLRVFDARTDGHHELRTLYQSIDLHDTLTCVERPGPFVLRTTAAGAAGVPSDRSNLVWRAAEALWRAAGRGDDPRDTAISLKKQIPPRSGLGGGSSDAASALMALSRLWRVRLDPPRLAELAAGLGADVPFFLVGGAALGVGRGEEIYPLIDLPATWVVLLLPGFGIATSDAYAWLDEERAGLRRPAEACEDARWGRAPALPSPASLQACPTRRSSGPGDYLRGLAWTAVPPIVNDLEAVVARRHPEIAAMTGALLDQGADAAAMSGSGSAVFGLFADRAAAARACRRLSRPSCRALVSRTLPRREYARRARPLQ